MTEDCNNKSNDFRERIKSLPTGPGLYFMKGQNDLVLYIGKAKNLRSRANSYFQPSADILESRGPKIVEMLKKVRDVDFLETKNEVDAILQEARLIKDIRPPYNTLLTDGKTFPYLEITTRKEFPGVYITRQPRKGSSLFGPFTSGKDLRQTLILLQKIYKFRTCNLEISESDPKRKFFRPCLLYNIKQCTAPCGDRVDKAEYRKIIRDVLRFLRSKRSVVLNRLKKQMAQASDARDYEKAALFRDRIKLIESLDDRGTPDSNVQPEVFASDPAKAIEKLTRTLKASEPIRIIEGIDIAHISGTDTVGSVVKFIDARPFKNGYRRFKIKTVKGIDDYACIAEVVRRRYKYAQKGQELWPNLILIDGGPGQLHAAANALKEINAPQLLIASLAKREDEIYLLDHEKPLKLPKNSPALNLLQYVRDEAHRFAQHYHHILRSKSMLNNK
jgi:excinuclease ABC subunit C